MFCPPCQTPRALLHVLCCAVAAFAGGAGPDAAGWPQFRGPSGQGIAEARNLPRVWSETQNVRWMTRLPGLGHSSPVIAENRVWLTSATDKGRRRHVVCVHLASGAVMRD